MGKAVQTEDWKCPACNGTGMAEPDCDQCGGNGWIDDEVDGGTMTCPTCLDDKCETCGGNGEAPATPDTKRSRP